MRLSFSSSFHLIRVSAMRAMPSGGMKFLGSPFSKIRLALTRKILPCRALGFALLRKRTIPGAVVL